MKSQKTRLKNAIRMFERLHPTSRVKSNLTRLLLAYLESIDDCQPDYHKELLSDLEGLIGLLDALDEPALMGRSLRGSLT